jgi:type III pantothenate kinase
MALSDTSRLLAVDIGNTSIKLGEFQPPWDDRLPSPMRTAVLPMDWADADISGFLTRDPAAFDWFIASVNRPAAARLSGWLAEQGARRVRQLSYTDLPLVIDVPRPERVGIDRLADAVAVNRLRTVGQPAITIDLGSAIKVDLVSAGGAFSGGAILPGIAMAARALHEFTDLLPLVDVDEPPAVLGTVTESAMRAGLYWGAVGAVRELVSRLASEYSAAQVFLTGGAAPSVAAILDRETEVEMKFVPHLTLAGIAISAMHVSTIGE